MQDETLEEIVDTSDARGARVREASVNENEVFPSRVRDRVCTYWCVVTWDVASFHEI